MICGLLGPDFPDAGGGICCMASAMGRTCTCWVPVFDLDQVEPAIADPGVRAKPCADCAYNVDSPERRGEDDVQGDEQLLARIVEKGERFFCHQGIRRPVRWEHRPEDLKPEDCPIPNATVPGSPADYSPPIIDGVPYKADGSPADVCAGWAARRAAYERTCV